MERARSSEGLNLYFSPKLASFELENPAEESNSEKIANRRTKRFEFGARHWPMSGIVRHQLEAIMFQAFKLVLNHCIFLSKKRTFVDLIPLLLEKRLRRVFFPDREYLFAILSFICISFLLFFHVFVISQRLVW